MTEETKRLLIRKGMTNAQASSRALELFIEIAAQEKGLVTREVLEKAKEIEKLQQEADEKISENQLQLNSQKRVQAKLEAEIARLREQEAGLREQVDKLEKRKLNEGMDDIKVRNFVLLAKWIASQNFTEQELKTIGFIGNGFFAGDKVTGDFKMFWNNF